jgi:hypothetical protein
VRKLREINVSAFYKRRLSTGKNGKVSAFTENYFPLISFDDNQTPPP